MCAMLICSNHLQEIPSVYPGLYGIKILPFWHIKIDLGPFWQIMIHQNLNWVEIVKLPPLPCGPSPPLDLSTS